MDGGAHSSGRAQGYWHRTARLGFARWGAGDFAQAWRLWGDPKVTALVGGPFTEAQVLARFEKQLANERAHGLQYWPLHLLSSGEFIGACGLKPYVPAARIKPLGDDDAAPPVQPDSALALRLAETSLEHGFYLLPQHHGQGYGYEAARAVLAHAFDTLGARSVFAGHHPDNHISGALLRKLGFTLLFGEFYEFTQRWHPGYLLSTEEWSRAPAR